MKIFQLLVGGILAIGFFILAIFGLSKEWKGRYIFLCLVASVAILFTSLDWVQGFVETQVVTSLMRTSKQYGEKLNDFQKTTGEMKVELTKQQDEISIQQKDLLSQQLRIGESQKKIDIQQGIVSQQQISIDKQEHNNALLQSNLASNQLSLIEQQKRLENVQYLVQKLYSSVKTEHYDSSNSNRVLYLPHGNDTVKIFFMLDAVPVINSVQAYYGNSPLLPPISNIGNVLFVLCKGSWDTWKSFGYTISYIPDSDPPNKYEKMDVKDGKVNLIKTTENHYDKMDVKDGKVNLIRTIDKRVEITVISE